MSIFIFDDYRAFLRSWLKSQPKRGHGILKTWSEELRIHPTILSQVLGGKRHLSLEHTDGIARLLNLSESESQYFLFLVLAESAGTVSLKERWRKRLSILQKQSKRISERVNVDYELSSTAQAEYYSSWLYTATRNCCSIDGLNTLKSIATHLQIEENLCRQILDFLVEHKLCLQSDGRYSPGPAFTHIPKSSPLVEQHHKNWRVRAMNTVSLRREHDLFFTAPMTMAKKDKELVQEKILQLISDLRKILETSPCETTQCLSIDFFEF